MLNKIKELEQKKNKIVNLIQNFDENKQITAWNPLLYQNCGMHPCYVKRAKYQTTEIPDISLKKKIISI